MTALNSRSSLAVVVLMGVLIALSAPLAAEQRGPSRTKMPRRSSESQKSATSEMKQPAEKASRRTPFGETKGAAKPDDPAPRPATSPYMAVEEKGDVIVFKRRTPFGQQTWKKKRSELNPQEEKMLRAHQAKQPDDSTADKPEPASAEAATSR
jgi:hypothetical protein